MYLEYLLLVKEMFKEAQANKKALNKKDWE